MIMRYLQISLAVIIIASCAGGGGSSRPAPVLPPETNTGPTFEELKANFESNYEYQRQWGLSLINASSAYARGFTGDDVIIGITDSGLDISHPEIDANRISSGSALSYDDYNPNTREMRHGTMVASIAAGALSENAESPMHGVAFNADIFFVAIQLSEPDDDYEPIDLGDGPGGAPDPSFLESIDNFFEWVASVYTTRNIDIVNNSYGFNGNIADYSEEIIRNAFPKTIAAIAQEDKNPADRSIFVWAAGNAGGYADYSVLDENGNVKCDQTVNFCSPEVYPGMTYFIDEVQGHSIAVVSVDEDGVISSFSNRCGLASDFCIAAPGEGVIAAYATSASDYGFLSEYPNEACLQDNSCYARVNGTSFAAPVVSGALAVMFEAFEGQLGSTEIVTRLFATADDSGIYSDSSIYGHGLLDLNAATNPVGSLSVATAGSVFGPVSPLLFSGLNIYNPSISQSITDSLKNKSLIALDELGSPFRIALGGLISSPSMRSQRINTVGAYGLPKRKLFSNKTFTFEYIDRNPINNMGNFLISHFESYAEINKSLNIFDYTNNRVISIGLIDDLDHDLHNTDQWPYQMKNPYLDLSKHGILFSQTFDNNNFSLSLIANIGQPKINFEDIFHEHDMNLNLSMLLQMPIIPNLQIGFLKENNRLIGLSSSGAFQLSKDSNSLYIGAHKEWGFSNGMFYLTAYKSFYENSEYTESLITGFSNIKTSYFGSGLMISDAFLDIDLEIGITKPLHISDGNLNFELPIYRDRYFNLYVENISVPLNKTDKELITNIKFKRSIGSSSWFLNIENVQNPSYLKSKSDYTNISIGTRLNF